MQAKALSKSVYAALAVTWLLVCAWLAVERGRVDKLARNAALNRGKDISNTIAAMSRSSGFGGFVWQNRLEAWLDRLLSMRNLQAVALLNSKREAVASAGDISRMDLANIHETVWHRNSVTIFVPVDMTQDEATTRTMPIVLDPNTPRSDFRRRDGRTSATLANGSGPQRGQTPPPGSNSSAEANGQRLNRDGDSDRDRNGGPRANQDNQRRDDRRDDDASRRRAFTKPPWMEQKDYEELIAKRGLHAFVLEISTHEMHDELQRDLWLRVVVASVALVAVLGLGVAWSGQERSMELQLRLVRSQELNDHLREMNLSAAGLAHETRNPLNIVRGLAHMIAQNAALPEALRPQAKQITEEVDLVTQRLNEFIKFSKPIQPRPLPIALADVARQVLETLHSDLEDKHLESEVRGPELTGLADESLLRQALFNLVLNAIRAVPEGGKLAVVLQAGSYGEAVLSVEDNGPGVPQDLREKVFRPYFTTHEEGSGLGLAVVKQIVLAHHWEIDYQESSMGGASFRISGIKLQAARESSLS